MSPSIRPDASPLVLPETPQLPKLSGGVVELGERRGDKQKEGRDSLRVRINVFGAHNVVVLAGGFHSVTR
eukprot:5471371-Alexandrium_andersonii.AAC.1